MVLIVSNVTICSFFSVEFIRELGSDVKVYIIFLLVGLLSLAFSVPIGRLCIYHIKLIKLGLTSNEEIKQTFSVINN
jgi:ABC-type multidrug transport system permease subunit